MKTHTFIPLCVTAIALSASATFAEDASVADDVVEAQRVALATSTSGAGFGPQSPRDIDAAGGANGRVFQASPPSAQMNLCNIHFHENAEHRGGNFTTYAGNGDGGGYGTGYKYDGELSAAELAPTANVIGEGAHGTLEPGDTIEVHFVHSTAQITPGPTLGSCLSEAIMNPQLRVETQVFVLVNDAEALDFTELAAVVQANGMYQPAMIPSDTGTPVEYAGSTTGPSYNEAGSPLQVWWSVRPQVAKLNINSVDAWLSDNPFAEDHAHGVRNLVMNPDLLSEIGG